MSQLPPENNSSESQNVADIQAALPDFAGPKPRPESLGSVLYGGCISGVLLNFVLGFVLLALQRAGISLYGPGVVAVVVALLLLVCVLREWPRRTMIGIGGVILGMVLTYAALRLFVEPVLRAIPETTPQSQTVPDSRGNAEKTNS